MCEFTILQQVECLIRSDTIFAFELVCKDQSAWMPELSIVTLKNLSPLLGITMFPDESEVRIFYPANWRLSSKAESMEFTIDGQEHYEVRIGYSPDKKIEYTLILSDEKESSGHNI